MENPDLSIDIQITVEKDFLLIVATGQYSLSNANNLFKCSIDEAILNNRSKVLIDVTNINGTIPVFDRYDFSKFLANYQVEHALTKVNKIAVVGNEPIIDKDRFGETVAVNRGSNARVFTDMTEANYWLNAD